ncbi:MAG TPA: RluA family pseudouridine synthase, partial [Aggregatilineales bacterium]|nr:RluA family pseudouridine synthase [Aggregatilineales bacterium]
MESDTVTLTITIEDEGKRLDKLLSEKFPEYSRVQIQVAIRTGQMLVNEITSKPAYHVTAGDSITFTPLEKEKSMEIVPQEIPLDVIYEDEYLVAINKPAGLVVHPGAGHTRGTLVSGLLGHTKNLSGIGGVQRPGIVHR